MTGFNVSVGGKAVVCCVHDRPKREVTTERRVADLGLQVGQVYDPRQHRLWLCACCENLFVDPSDEPRYCGACRRGATYSLGGPPKPPNGTPLI